MTVLVTGSTGFLGSAVVRDFTDAGWPVLGLSRSESLLSVDLSESGLDVTELELPKLDSLVHTAGLAHQFGNVPVELFTDVNVGGTKKALEIARHFDAQHFVLVSSVSVYGTGSVNGEPVDESVQCNPIGPYAESKYQSELLAQKFCGDFGMGLTILRPATIIGKGDKGNVARLASQIAAGRFLWVGSGANRKSLVCNSDVAMVCRRVVENALRAQRPSVANKTFNVTSPALTMNRVVSVLAESIGRSVPRLRVPDAGARLLAQRSATIAKFIRDDFYAGEELSFLVECGGKAEVERCLAAQVAELVVPRM